VYVGGDLNALQDVSGGVSNASVGDATGTLIVGGNVAADVTKGGAGKAGGDIAVGGTNLAGSNLLADGGTVRTGVDVPVAEVATAIKGLSTYWAGLADTTAYSIGGDSNNPVLSLGAPSSDGYAVISMAGPDLLSMLNQNANLGFGFDGGTPYTTIINVPGSSFNFAGKINEFSGGNNVLFNFHQATSISINSPFAASIFAPLANINAGSGGAGANAIMVGNDIVQRYEIRVPFSGTVPTPPDTAAVPLPAAGWLLAGGLAGLAALRRRAA
jgi:choice-of-anchor A domain-containing protein